MSTDVVLIRPGATTYDEENRVQGVLDVPLCPRGRAEAEALASALAGLDLAALYHGPAENATRTAEAIGRAAGLRPRLLDELRNLDQGLWQGLQRDEIRRRNNRLYRRWLEDPSTICPPRGETVAAALERVRPALKMILRRHRGEVVGLVVAEPLARLLAGALRGEDGPALDEAPPTGCFERIPVEPD